MDTEWERHINAWLHRMEEVENAFDPEEGEDDFTPFLLSGRIALKFPDRPHPFILSWKNRMTDPQASPLEPC